MNIQTNFKDFSLSWRFTDDNYNVLPPDDLVKITALTSDETKRLWNEYVSNEYDHLLKIPKIRYGDKEIIKFKVDWENEELARHIIIKNTALADDTRIIFFWSVKCAVKTTWGLFIKYWSDFCYPDDDNVIVTLDNETNIYFCEEQFSIMKR